MKNNNNNNKKKTKNKKKQQQQQKKTTTNKQGNNGVQNVLKKSMNHFTFDRYSGLLWFLQILFTCFDT